MKNIKKAGRPVIKMTVQKSTAPISYHGVFYIRSGSTTSELNGNELSRFLLSRAGASWDGIVEARASFDDISVKAVRNFQQLAKKRFPFIAKEKSVRLVLRKLNLVEKGKLKRAAVLLFGKDPRKYFSSAFIQVGRFVSESEVISTDVIEGNLFEQVEKTIEVLRLKYLENRFYYEGLLRKEDMIYPEEALREAVVNAVIHRDYLGPHTQLRVYDRKLWLWNAGELSEKITFEKLKKAHLSCPRNELLADVFFKTGYIEAWGRGTIKIVDACRKINLPDPEFSELTGGFLVSFSRAPGESQPELPTQSPTQSTDPVIRLLFVLREGSFSARQLRAMLKIKHRPTFRENYLHPALKGKFIEYTIPQKPNSRLQKYRLTPKGAVYFKTQSGKKARKGGRES